MIFCALFVIMFLMKKRQMIILFSILAFIMLLVALNSLVFSIREVRADCFNSNDSALIGRVTEASGIKLYKNIITLNKTKAVRNIDGEMGSEVKVVNIERKFPNKVWIHFVKLVPILAFETDGGYVTCDNNLMVIEKDVPFSALMFNADVDEVDKNIDGESRPIVRARIKEGTLKAVAGKPLELSDPDALAALRTVVDTINRLDYEEYDFVRLLKEIDMTEYNDAVNPVIKLKMRDSGGKSITIIIQNSKKLLLEKVQHSISVYDEYLQGKKFFKSTTWTAFNNSKGKIYIEDTV